MHIGLFIPTLYKGGAEKIASELSLHLPSDWDITLILLENKIEYPYRGNVVVLNKNAFFLKPLSYVFQLRKIIREKEIDVIISFDEKAGLLNVLSNPSKSIITIHKSLLMADKKRKYYSKILNIVRQLYNRADAIVGVSKGVSNELVSYVGLKKEKVRTIYNPYNIKNPKRRR